MSAVARLIGGPLQTERMPDGRRRLLRDLIVEVDSEIQNEYVYGPL